MPLTQIITKFLNEMSIHGLMNVSVVGCHGCCRNFALSVLTILKTEC